MKFDGFHRVIFQAFRHKDVQKELGIVDQPYLQGDHSDTEEAKEARKSQTIDWAGSVLRMLTGYPIWIREAGVYNSVDLSTDLIENDSNPTIILEKDEGLRPLIMSGTDSYRLLDCRMGGTLNEKASGGTQRSTVAVYKEDNPSNIHNETEAYDRLRTEDEVLKNMTVVIRLGTDQTLNSSDAVKKLDPAIRAAFNAYYYEDHDV